MAHIATHGLNSKLSIWQKFILLCGGKTFLGYKSCENWVGSMPFYLFKCRGCGNFSKDYPHGNIPKTYFICIYCQAKNNHFM